jgi:hypothetical protein
MSYTTMPVIIPLLATGYLLTVYLLLMLAQRTVKSSGYAPNSFTDAYAHAPTDQPSQADKVERWALRVSQAAPLGLAKQEATASQELSSTASSPQKVQQASSLR